MAFTPTRGLVLDDRYQLVESTGTWALGETWRATDLRVTSRAVEIRFARVAGAWDPIAVSQVDREADSLLRGPRGLIDRGKVDAMLYLVTGLGTVAQLETRDVPGAALASTSFSPITAHTNPPLGASMIAASSPFAPRVRDAALPEGSPFAPSPAPALPATYAPHASRFVGSAVIGVLIVLLAAALAVKVVLERSTPRVQGSGSVLGAIAPGSPPQVDATRIPVGGSPVLGSQAALITLVEFGDFQCPFCQRVQATLGMLRARYGDDLRIVWKNDPLPFHANAQLAAEAALAGAAQGRFWPMHALLYADRNALSRQDVERYAAQLGLDLNRFRNDLDVHTFAPQIAADQALARALDATGTPAFFINGTQLSGAQPVEAFTALIDPMLATARTISPSNMVYATMTDATPLVAPVVAIPPSPPPIPPRTLDPNALYRVPVSAAQPSLGPSDALVTIVVFSDFQCPFCARAEPTLAAVRLRYGADVRIVWRNHPLPFHSHAMPAAEAAAEVFAQQSSEGFFATTIHSGPISPRSSAPTSSGTQRRRA